MLSIINVPKGEDGKYMYWAPPMSLCDCGTLDGGHHIEFKWPCAHYRKDHDFSAGGGAGGGRQKNGKGKDKVRGFGKDKGKGKGKALLANFYEE